MIHPCEDWAVPFSQEKRSNEQHFPGAWGAAASILSGVTGRQCSSQGHGVVLQCHGKAQRGSSSRAQSPQGREVWCSVHTHMCGALAPCTLACFHLLSVDGTAQIFVLITVCYHHWKCQSVTNTLHHHTASSFTVAAVSGDILLNRKVTHWTIAQLDYKRMFVLGKKLSLRFPPLLISVFHA